MCGLASGLRLLPTAYILNLRSLLAEWSFYVIQSLLLQNFPRALWRFVAHKYIVNVIKFSGLSSEACPIMELGTALALVAFVDQCMR